LDRATGLLDKMREQGNQPTVVTYNMLISNKAQDYDAAKALVDTMCKEGIQPNALTYRLINAKK